MTHNPSRNGADQGATRERPDWYVPIAPIEDDGRTKRQSLVDLFGTTPPDVPDDVRDEMVAELDRHLLARED